MLASAVQAGLDKSELLTIGGLRQEDIEDRDANVDLDKHVRMAREIVLRLPGVNIGLHSGMTATPARFGVLGYLLRQAPTFRQALFDFARFQHLVSDAVSWHIELGPPCRITLTLHPLIAHYPAAAEVPITTILAVGRHLTGVRIIPTAVSFRHPSVGDPREHEAFFGIPVRFCREETALVFDGPALDLPVTDADELLRQHLLHFVQAVLSNLRALPLTSEAVRQQIVKMLHRELPRRLPVARALGMGERTMLRRLAQEGQTFESLLDATRHELAREYLKTTRLATFEIAALLGYTEPSPFHRAFRRWTGYSPQAYRRTSQVQPT